MTYAHHGQIRCYTWRRSTLGPVQRWDAYCACGWHTEDEPDWPCAYWALARHQTDLEPSWIVFPGFGVRWDDDPLDRCHNTTSNALQRAYRPNGARA